MKCADRTVFWARLNRQIIAERAAEALRADVELVSDVPHNILTQTPDGWLHRKGAAVAADLVPVAGARATSSYLLRPLGQDQALASLSHGAGRRYVLALCMGGCEDDIGHIFSQQTGGSLRSGHESQRFGSAVRNQKPVRRSDR